MQQTDFTCPACGEEVHPNARSCAKCGTTPENGWASGGEIIDGVSDIELPFSDEEFDYDDFVAREFDGKGNRRPDDAAGARLNTIWIVTGLVLFIAILVLIYYGIW